MHHVSLDIGLSLIRLIMLKLDGAPFNVNSIQAYAPISDYSDEEVEEFYEHPK